MGSYMKKKKLILRIITTITILSFILIFAYIIYDLFNPLKELLINGNDKDFSETIESYGIWKYVFMILFSTFQIFMTIMPGEPIQVLSGIICGPFLGVLVCLAGVAIGNLFMFLLVRTIHFEIDQKRYEKKGYSTTIDESKTNDKKAFTWFILGLYFAPVIPDGAIAYTAAKNKKMGFIRYMIVTTLGTIPQIVLCITAGTLFMKYSSEIFKLTEIFPLLIGGLIIFITIFLVIKYKKNIINHVLNRSIRATAIWVLPFIILALIDASLLATHKYIACSIIFGIMIIYIIMYIIFDERLSKIFTKKKMDDFKNDIVLKPNRFLIFILTSFFKLFYHPRFNLKIDKNGIDKIEKPAIILFNHQSAIDFMNIIPSLYPNKINVVTAYYYFCNYHIGRILNKCGCFPKFLYQPDISAIKNMHKVIKNNGVLLLSPEGRLSAYGEMESYIPSTIKFLKKENCDVYLVKSYGTYFTKPKWAKTYRRGRIDMKYEHIFENGSLTNLSYEDIYKILYDKLYYNEYDWMKENKVPFKGKKFSEGLEQILYICPVCGKEFTYESKKNKMKCSHCHTVVKLNKYYELESENPSIPHTIRDWYIYQKETERKNVKNLNYTYASNVTLKLPDPKGNGFVIVGKGKCTLSYEGVRYVGTINNEEKNILFKLENIPAIPFGVKEDFEIYHDQTLYYFIPDNIRECVKWSVVEEQMYEEFLERNDKKPWDF